MAGVFLQAQWKNLIMANYAIEPSLLLPYLPAGTELDFYKSICYVSLVGFMFENTKMLGVKIPFHVNFEEVNLRFYVKRKQGNEWRRGVVFLKEIVSKPAITLVANTLYNENYATFPTSNYRRQQADGFTIGYKWGYGKNKHEIACSTTGNKFPFAAGSKEEFITEHYWGYAKGKKYTTEYAVEHPSWMVYEATDYSIKCDFGKLYGQEFKHLEKEKPSSVFMAEGSDIIVRKGSKLY